MATRLWRSRRARWATAFTALLFFAGLAGYGIRAARASGIPTTQALTYAGVLEDGAGAALTGAHNVQVAVYDAASAGNLLCQMAAAQSVTLANGRFVVSLPDACAASFGLKSDTWVDVAVDGASTGRSKVGVVPYAIEANHSVNATSATNFGISGNLSVGGVTSVGFHVSQNCTFLSSGSGHSACACNANEVALSGGGYAVSPNFLQGSNPTPGSTNSWDAACADPTGARVQCSAAYAICARLAP